MMFSIYILILYLILIAWRPTRKLALALTPWLVFACSYDWMRLLPNYKVNPIDVQGLYESEKSLFGISETILGGQQSVAPLTPCEYFARHHHPVTDMLAGLFYLCWVPVPIAFALYLFFKGERMWYLRFSLAFLFVNLLGFAGYYIHPAAPPWYVMTYGFEPIIGIPGHVAGLGRFDDMTGVGIFHALYGQNANVFAAVPSLHAAYMLIATIYAILARKLRAAIPFSLICIGIWWTAVYTGHHYVIDVLLGIATALIGTALLEYAWRQIPCIRHLLERYTKTIS